MWSLPTQAMTIVLKERDGLSAGQMADFMLLGTIPWLLKPAYGLLADFVPLFGRRRQSYLLLTSGLAALAGFTLALSVDHTYWRLALLYTAMGLGLAFTDVLIDALMVENGRRLALTGAFQSVQWFSIYAATILVGVVGGRLAEARALHLAFALAACFPLLSFVMAARAVHEPRGAGEAAAFRETWQAIRAAARRRDVWVVAGFIFLFNFSPSFGPAFLYYQTDVLRFDQPFIGLLASLGAAGSMLGAVLYPPLARRFGLKPLIVAAIAASAAATLAYLLYRDRPSAMVIDVAFGVLAMLTQLVFLDLAAKACPPRVESTYFALLMSVYNGASQLATNVGGRLYDAVGFTTLVLISATTTALTVLLVPLVPIDVVEERARRAAAAAEGEPQSVSAR